MEQALKVLALAVDVLKAHRLFFSVSKPVIRITSDGTLYQLPIPVDAKTSAALTEEVIEKLVQQDLDNPSFSFSFIPAQYSPKRDK